jgi:hypothetical protein
MKIRLSILAVVGTAMLGAGCAATVPVMPEEYDAAAERFEPSEGTGMLYIVRDDSFFGSGVIFRVEVDGLTRGSIGPGTYFAFELPPGDHVISSSGMENADLAHVTVTAGQCCFVEIHPEWGMLAARVSVEPVDETRGRSLVIEGQRAEALPEIGDR